MKTGDLVSKKSGYKYVGYIVADFTKTTGERRLVVECKNTGMLHVFNEDNLELFTEEEQENLELSTDEEQENEVFFAEVKGTYYLIPRKLIINFWKDYNDESISELDFDLKYNNYWIEDVIMNNKLYIKPKK